MTKVKNMHNTRDTRDKNINGNSYMMLTNCTANLASDVSLENTKGSLGLISLKR
jgi:hypothetical protein